MSEFTITIVDVVLGLLFFIALFINIAISNKFKRENQQLVIQVQAHELLLHDIQIDKEALNQQLEQLKKQIELKATEDIQVSKQMEHRVKVLSESQDQFNSALEQLQAQQPQDKLYTRAYKLAALGADTEEIMTECELPRAEVEMLLSVYHQQN